MTLIVRAELPADIEAIRVVHESAFPTPMEADLVDALRADGDLVLSLVAEREGVVAGHVAFSRMMVRDGNDEAPALALAPVAVTPDFQREGIGSALIERALEQLAEDGETLVFVLGEPDYYGRFGFSAQAASGFEAPYPAPYFQARRLRDDARASGSVHYAQAFAELS